MVCVFIQLWSKDSLIFKPGADIQTVIPQSHACNFPSVLPDPLSPKLRTKNVMPVYHESDNNILELQGRVHLRSHNVTSLCT